MAVQGPGRLGGLVAVGGAVVLSAWPVFAATGTVAATDAVTASIVALAQQALAYAGVLAAAGTVAMAFVELLKALVDLRRYFHQQMVGRWLGAGRDQVLPELLFLAIGDQRHDSVLYGQSIEKLMGQVQAAARIALDYPDKFPRLFTFLTSSDFEPRQDSQPVGRVAPADRSAWTRHAHLVQDVSAHLRTAAPGAADPAADAAAAQAASDAAQARARLASLVARKLDGFQLRTEFWWSRINQALGIGMSVVIVELAVKQSLALSEPRAFAVGLMGGLLAPFAKDFTQSLAGLAAK